MRGDARAYDRYVTAMDAAMRVKVAGAAAHLLTVGKVADMGMGSGAGSHALAALYPRLEVVGVDLDAEMVERARARYQLPNLSFVVGDVAEAVFEPESLTAIFNSSVLHHVTSFGGYDHERAARALAAQVEQLAPGGMMIVRDFLAPSPLSEDGAATGHDAMDEVWLDLPADDGDDSNDPRTCSTAALFERFATEFRSLHPAPGFDYETRGEPRAGWRRYQLAHRHAVEFVLRKDYRTDWEAEVREEYLYFDQDGFSDVFERLGLRLAASIPIHNPWIVQNRFEGRFEMFDLDDGPVAHPATNVLVAGEKVRETESFAFDAWDEAPIDYLTLEGFVDRRTGLVVDLVSRPGRTFDVVPFFFDPEGDLFVVARMGYPRPILGGSIGLDGSIAPSYVNEPFVVVAEGDTDPLDVALPKLGLSRDAMLSSGIAVLRTIEGAPFFASPGAIHETVRPLFVEVPAMDVVVPSGGSGFSTDGRLRAIDARQVLRAAEVGAMPDARLPLHIRDLCAHLGLGVGPWIGAALNAPTFEVPASPLPEPEARQVYAPSDETSGFLEVGAQQFTERDRGFRQLTQRTLEVVTTTEHGDATIVIALYAMTERGVAIGLVDDDRPAAQLVLGSSQLVTVPAYRVPVDVTTMAPALDFIRDKLRTRHGVEVGPMRDLGGRYYPAPGLTAELVHPLAAPVLSAQPGTWPEPLTFTPLPEVGQNAEGHTRIVLARLIAALSPD